MSSERTSKPKGLSAGEYARMYSAEGSFFWFVAKRGLIDDLLKRSVV